MKTPSKCETLKSFSSPAGETNNSILSKMCDLGRKSVLWRDVDRTSSHVMRCDRILWRRASDVEACIKLRTDWLS